MASKGPTQRTARCDPKGQELRQWQKEQREERQDIGQSAGDLDQTGVQRHEREEGDKEAGRMGNVRGTGEESRDIGQSAGDLDQTGVQRHEREEGDKEAGRMGNVRGTGEESRDIGQSAGDLDQTGVQRHEREEGDNEAAMDCFTLTPSVTVYTIIFLSRALSQLNCCP
ncbi:hypothetical protein EOD39_0651 [Acipenser ruthenus]|uniref:Uncharacterized protein n=1 Tax=Acipenser ruthenus TaxID=7906 RepID=A0A444TXN8_ACIRT|nr:hypothetical protein EOD39_0651 [Acipenser ruthenus]